jgi:hypothetical protein
MPGDWPNQLDLAARVIFFAVIIGVPLLGYVCLALDIRAYLRSLRRALVVVRNYLPHLPGAGRTATPRCLLMFDLAMPCTEEQLMTAYRAKVKVMHPDVGGDRARFLILQRFFDEALDYVRRYGPDAEV